MNALLLLRRGAAAALATVGLVLAWPGGASAASYAVEPSSFTLTPEVRNATVTLTNLSREPIRLQVSGLAWSENDAGTVKLAPSSAIVVFPQLFTIPASGTQRVRAAVVGPALKTEQTFRIVVEDLPPLGEVVHAMPGTRITMRTRFTLAIYAEPARRTSSWHIADASQRGSLLSFTVLNLGNTHLAGDSLSVNGSDAGGRATFAGKIENWHVLAGGRRVYTLDVGAACIRKLTISPGAGSTPATQTVDVAACT